MIFFFIRVARTCLLICLSVPSKYTRLASVYQLITRVNKIETKVFPKFLKISLEIRKKFPMFHVFMGHPRIQINSLLTCRHTKVLAVQGAKDTYNQRPASANYLNSRFIIKKISLARIQENTK